MSEHLQTVKNIAADILYVDDVSLLGDNVPLGDFGFSSIDYIDLCFEFKRQISEMITPENLWPFDSMLMKNEYFDGENWTDAGWNEVCNILKIDPETELIVPNGLVVYFTPSVLASRVEQIVGG